MNVVTADRSGGDLSPSMPADCYSQQRVPRSDALLKVFLERLQRRCLRAIDRCNHSPATSSDNSARPVRRKRWCWTGICELKGSFRDSGPLPSLSARPPALSGSTVHTEDVSIMGSPLVHAAGRWPAATLPRWPEARTDVYQLGHSLRDPDRPPSRGRAPLATRILSKCPDAAPPVNTAQCPVTTLRGRWKAILLKVKGARQYASA
jgi:hypothetical protein